MKGEDCWFDDDDEPMDVAFRASTVVRGRAMDDPDPARALEAIRPRIEDLNREWPTQLERQLDLLDDAIAEARAQQNA